jgi:uncharacterized protein YegP (UPF0339 family)
MRKAKFEISKDKADEYRFRLVASNGKVVAVSEGYTTKAMCKVGARAVIKAALSAEIVEV